MEILRSIWTALTSLVAIGIFLGMLSVASTPFETIVVSGMALVYSSVIAYGAITVRTQIANSIAHTNQFIFLAKLHGAPEKEEEISVFEEDAKTIWEEFQKKNVIYYINIFFIFLIWLVAVGAIILAL